MHEAIMMATFSARLLLPLLVAIAALAVLGQAFVIPSTTTSHCSTQQSPRNQLPRDPVSLFAKKKRRRRKKSDDAQSSAPEPEIVEAAPEPVVMEAAAAAAPTNELPDFDLGAGETDSAAKEVVRTSVTDPEAITANMMGSGSRGPSKSLDELINDRSLETRFEFEEQGDASIPDFVDLARASTTEPTYSPDGLNTAGVGKKKQRQAERVARAIAAKEAAEPEEDVLAKFFPQFLDEKGNFSAIKLLENGAWLGIFLLVVWEFYINSPFFDRAAPLAPVVFEIVM